MRGKLSILGYCVFGVFLFYLFFLWQLPYDHLKKVVIQGFEETVPLKLAIGKIRPSFPNNLTVEKVQILSESFSVQVPDLTLKPNFLGLLWGKREFHLIDSRSERLQTEYHR